MIYSYSSLSKYLQCPKKFWHLYIEKDFQESREVSGVSFHSEAENFFKGERAEPPGEAWVQGVMMALKQPITVAEMALAVDKDWQPTGYYDKNARLRGKMDLVLNMQNFVWGIDWKSGKKSKWALKSNEFQASVYGPLLSVKYMKPVAMTFVYVNEPAQKMLPTSKNYVAEMVRTTALMDEIDNQKVFEARSGPLCAYCPVISCKHNRNET